MVVFDTDETNLAVIGNVGVVTVGPSLALELIHLVSMLKNFFFPLSLMIRPNKQEGLSLESLSSQVLEFEGKARANQIGVPSSWVSSGCYHQMLD
jgi:hypothetical protein